MLIFVTSDKGGTGRSVTSGNLAYRRALYGDDVCYLDFDFGSPTAAGVFDIAAAGAMLEHGGLHSYLQGRASTPRALDVWAASDRRTLSSPTAVRGRLDLFPGDAGGGEFAITPQATDNCVDLLLRLEEEFDCCFVDCSAGRSYALDMMLTATADPRLAHVCCRWLVFHRWTRQHVAAAAGLVFGPRGVLQSGIVRGHDREALRDSVRFVRTAVPSADAHGLGQLRPSQVAWLRECDDQLRSLAVRLHLGPSVVLGTTPFEPLLQWREQIITDADVSITRVANAATVDAFDDLARRLSDATAWEGL
ncbi:SCO2523 family variant P-loop protein [Yinghuangia aomiensis]|uniref:SCO2523 family variant P-loop protein n=1 Tax=Yinghuangia aomiensis TaxID=676205 RepID=A0ABP9H503_9ACTN